MKIGDSHDCNLGDLVLIEPAQPRLISVPIFSDERGTFSKPFHETSPGAADFIVRELYWSSSSRATIRGIHFQTPPNAIGKLIWVSKGSIFDAVVDLRTGPTFGQVHTFTLDAVGGNAVWVPAGFGHGFQALAEDSIVNYATDGPYSPEDDTGVLWDSAGVQWPLSANSISNRDQSFVRLSDFDSPF